MTILKLLGKKIQTIREKRDLTQEKLEEKTGINAKYISALERGQINLTVNTLEKLSKGLDIELYELFIFSVKPESCQSVKKAIESLMKDTDIKTLVLTLEFLKKAVN